MVMTDEIKNETVEEEVEASGKEVEDEVKHEVLGYPDRVPNCHKGSSYKHSYIMLWFILFFIIFSILVSFFTNPL